MEESIYLRASSSTGEDHGASPRCDISLRTSLCATSLGVAPCDRWFLVQTAVNGTELN